MKTNFTWTKRFFSESYNIFSYGENVGYIKSPAFSRNTTGKINGKMYCFTNKGFAKNISEIKDLAENKVVGIIELDVWMTQAKISVNQNTLKWKYDRYDDIWCAKWILYNSDGVMITYLGSSAKGKIEVDTDIDTDLSILSGLFVSNYFRKITFFVLVSLFFSMLAILWS